MSRSSSSCFACSVFSTFAFSWFALFHASFFLAIRTALTENDLIVIQCEKLLFFFALTCTYLRYNYQRRSFACIQCWEQGLLANYRLYEISWIFHLTMSNGPCLCQVWMKISLWNHNWLNAGNACRSLQLSSLTRIRAIFRLAFSKFFSR